MAQVIDFYSRIGLSPKQAMELANHLFNKAWLEQYGLTVDEMYPKI